MCCADKCAEVEHITTFKTSEIERLRGELARKEEDLRFTGSINNDLRREKAKVETDLTRQVNGFKNKYEVLKSQTNKIIIEQQKKIIGANGFSVIDMYRSRTVCNLCKSFKLRTSMCVTQIRQEVWPGA